MSAAPVHKGGMTVTITKKGAAVFMLGIVLAFGAGFVTDHILIIGHIPTGSGDNCFLGYSGPVPDWAKPYIPYSAANKGNYDVWICKVG